MNSISNFFQKFLNLEKDKSLKISLILEAIKKEAGIDLKKEEIELKGNIAKLKCSPIFRNEIFMRKEKIESLLKSQKIFLRLF